MLSREENTILTQTGPGTPMGNLMRKYWIPALLSKEVPDHSSPPVKVMLLNEKLIAFRNSEGKMGLISERCPHRGASLSFGHVKGQGITCAYHGWEFETDGSCIHFPKIKAKTYPCLERGGIVWTYMGTENPPSLPELPMNMGANSHELVQPALAECNWLQNLEASLDLHHIKNLHSSAVEKLQKNVNPEMKIAYEQLEKTPSGRIEAFDTDGGCAFAGCEEISPGGDLCWGTGQFIFPFYAMLPFGQLGHHWIHAVVPMDDHHSMIFQMSMDFPFFAHPFSSHMFGEEPHFLPHSPDWFGRFRTARNSENNFMAKTQSGRKVIEGQLIQDLAINHSMGTISDRSNEHLLSSDAPVIQVRKRLLKAAKELQVSGKNPPGIENPEVYRAKQGSFILPKDEDWTSIL